MGPCFLVTVNVSFYARMWPAFATIMYMENLPLFKMQFLDIMSSQKQDGMHHKTIVFIFDEIGIVRLTCLISIENGLVCLMT